MKRVPCTAEPGDVAMELALLGDELRVLESAIGDKEVERSTAATVCCRIQERMKEQLGVLEEMQDRWNDARASRGA